MSRIGMDKNNKEKFSHRAFKFELFIDIKECRNQFA